MNAIKHHYYWSAWILVLSLAVILSLLTEDQVQRATIVYRRKPGTLSRVNCGGNTADMCTTQRVYCAGFHIGSNHFVTGTHCLVAADGTIRRPYELDILGLGLTKVEFVMHKDYDGFTGGDIGWIKVKEPLDVDYSLFVADITPFLCQYFALDVFDPNAQGLRTGYRWIAGIIEKNSNYIENYMRPATTIFNYDNIHQNEEVAIFCSTEIDHDRYELHYMLLGFLRKQMFMTDCHLAKCGYISIENVKAPPVADVDTTTIPATIEVTTYSSYEDNEAGIVQITGPDSADSDPDFLNRGSNFANKDLDLVSSSPDFVDSGPDLTNPDADNLGAEYVKRGPSFVNSGPNYSIAGPDFTNSGPDFLIKGSNFINKDLDFVNSESDLINSGPEFTNPDSNSDDNSDSNDINTGPDLVEDLHYINSDPDLADADPSDINFDASLDDEGSGVGELSRDFTVDDSIYDRSVKPLKNADVSGSTDDSQYDDDDEDDDDDDENENDEDDGTSVAVASQRAAVVSSFTTRRPAAFDRFSMTTSQPWLHLWKARMPAYFFKHPSMVESSPVDKPMEQIHILQTTNQPIGVHPRVDPIPLVQANEIVTLRTEVIENDHSSGEHEDGNVEHNSQTSVRILSTLPPLIHVHHTSTTDLPLIVVQNQVDVYDKLYEDEANDDAESDMQKLARGFNWPPTFPDEDGLEYVDARELTDQNRAYFGSNFTPNVVPCDCTRSEDKDSNDTGTSGNVTERTEISASAKASTLSGILMVAVTISIVVL